MQKKNMEYDKKCKISDIKLTLFQPIQFGIPIDR